MTKNTKLKFFLFLFIILFLTFYIFNINKNKGFIIEENKNSENLNAANAKSKSTTFENVEYNFTDTKNIAYVLKGKTATISNNDENIIYLDIVVASTKLKNGSALIIKSDKAKFYKIKKNIFFYKNIFIKNNDISIYADNAVFYQKKNLVEIFDNVILIDKKNKIFCDNLSYNMLTKNIIIKMNSVDKQIYGKRY